jgi:hypothetical protein
MNSMLMTRERVIVRRTTGPRKCEVRGHCGPFANESFYNAFPEAWWHGMGDCVECGTTCKVEGATNEFRATRSAA